MSKPHIKKVKLYRKLIQSKIISKKFCTFYFYDTDYHL